jgi:hypothetical protein
VPRRPALRPSAAVLLGLLGALTVSVVPAGAAPVTRAPSKAIEVFSPYQAQTTCNPTPKPGTLALSKLVMAAYPGTGTSGIARDCSLGGRSEHKEGRAWDWHVGYGNTKQRAQATDFAHWLFATDAYGNTFAQARRLGVMYVIWNKKIWSASSSGSGWRPYTGADPHTSHMHISLSWAGAQKKTSYWTGTVAPVLKAPNTPKTPAKPAPPIEAPAKDLFPDPVPDDSGHGKEPTAQTPVHNPNGLPVLAVGEGSIDVPADSAGLTTPFLLQGGRHYLLTATGSYTYGAAPRTADVECSIWPKDGTWHRRSQWETSSSSGHLDLTLQGKATSWTPVVDDGNGCDPTSTYTLMIQPREDGPLRLALRDDNRADNSGSVHVVVRPLDGAATD